MIDGSDNNDITVTISTSQIVPEAVAEFQVLTNPYNVEFGRNTGGQINVITKSGTNRFHGEAWEYYRTSELNARDQHREGQQPRPSRRKFNRHQFGGGIGGPIVSDKTVLLRPLPARPAAAARPARAATTIAHPDAGRVRRAARRSARRRARRRPAARPCSIASASCSDLYGQNPVVPQRREHARQRRADRDRADERRSSSTRARTTRSSAASTSGSADATTSPSATRYNEPRGRRTRSATARSARCSAGSQDLKDTNLALSETHVFGADAAERGAVLAGPAATCSSRRTIPTARRRRSRGLFTIGGLSNFPQGRVSGLLSVLGHADLDSERGHSLKFGADIRYIDARQHLGVRLEGHLHVQQPAGLHEQPGRVPFTQALQTASFVATQWQTSFFVAGRLPRARRTSR